MEIVFLVGYWNEVFNFLLVMVCNLVLLLYILLIFINWICLLDMELCFMMMFWVVSVIMLLWV